MSEEPHPIVEVAGMLLTGGRSRRMGFDKATAVINDVTNAQRLAQVLHDVVSPVIEVGPGFSGLPAAREKPPGSGPLMAIGAGVQALERLGHEGPALVVACDLPLVTGVALRMLAEWPGECSVVPLVDGRQQSLCARWSAADLASVARLVDAGERSMKSLLSRPGVLLLDEEMWTVEVEATEFADVDTPADLDRLGLSWQSGSQRAGPSSSPTSRSAEERP